MSTDPIDLRTDYAEQTRRRIARAAVEVLVEDGMEHLSFPAVAGRAGVSLRTVYRHFPNKDELVAGATSAGSEATTELFPHGAQTLAELGEMIPRLWQELYANHDLIVVQHATQPGQALRAKRLRRRHAEIWERLAVEYPDLTADARDRLATLLTVLMSSSLLIDLVDLLGLDVDHAAAAATFAIDACVEKSTREGAST